MTVYLKRFFSFLLVAVILNGCTSFNRQAYIKSHSFDDFMEDRLHAAEIIRQHPALEQWLRSEWSQPVEGFQITWDNQEPMRSSDAENVPSRQSHLIAIRVSKRLSALDQVFCLSFETSNARGLPQFDRATCEAEAGKISRADYVNKFETTEYSAILRMKECFPELLPYSTNMDSVFYRTFLEVPAGFEKYKNWQIQNYGQNYLRAHAAYGKDYDKILERNKISGVTTSSINSTNASPLKPLR